MRDPFKPISFDLTSRVILLTGASLGLVARFAKSLAAHGTKMALCARRINIGRTLISSVAIICLAACSKAKDEAIKGTKPNILLIVADDLGFSDLGAFGGEIDTPNLDSLAMSGVRLTSFYTAPTCSPTRSMLLTGKDHHAVGLGAMAEALPQFPAMQGQPGYEGVLDPNTSSIAEKFSEAGYRTMMSGKWHLGAAPEHQPVAHGFDRSFALIQGGADHYGEGQNGQPAVLQVNYVEDGQPSQYPIGEYSSDVYANQIIEYMNAEAGEDRPFFAYLAFTAPHWPLQATPDIIDKYKGRYDDGPAALRMQRLARMKELALLDEAALATNLVELDDWDSLSDNGRRLASRNMEIYAAMVDSLDQNVGRVLEHLKATGELENTFIFFMSDNGAEGLSSLQLGRLMQGAGMDGDLIDEVTLNNAVYENLGTKDSFLSYGNQWAQAAMAPFRNYKSLTEEGGIKSPAFVTGPGVDGGRIVDGLLSVRDIMPTALDVARIDHDMKRLPDPKNEGAIGAPTAKSWVPILTGGAETVRTENDPMAWELFYRRAVRLGDWKAVYTQGTVASGNPIEQAGASGWELYNLKTDPGESQNVKAENPEAFKRLMKAWDNYQKENMVVVSR